MMRNLILILHIITSIMAGVIAIIIVFRAIRGLINSREAVKWDIQLPLLTTLLLYIQLALGTVLFIYYMIDYTNGNIDFLKKSELQSRFWAVEHFILMVFTLVVSQVGWIFARNSKISKLIFKKNLLYFGVACVMIIVSMIMNVMRHAI